MTPDFPDDPDKIELTFSLEKNLNPAYDPNLDEWHISADIKAFEGPQEEHHVGDISILTMDPVHEGAGWNDLDVLAEDLSQLGESIFDLREGGLNRTLRERLAMTFNSRIMLLHHVHLTDAWRGSGWLGAKIAAEAIHRLSPGVGLVFTYPFPLEPIKDDDAHQAAVMKLRRVWRGIGFRLYRKGIYMIDMSERTFEDALKKIREQ